MLKIDFEMERVDYIFGCNKDIIFVLKEKEKEEEKLTNFCLLLCEKEWESILDTLIEERICNWSNFIIIFLFFFSRIRGSMIKGNN